MNGSQLPLNEAQQFQLAAQMGRLHDALLIHLTAPWRFGHEIVALKNLYTEFGASISDFQISQIIKTSLGKRLCRKRIGDYRNIYEYFPEQVRDYTMDFKLYERARIANDKRTHPLEPAELVQVMVKAGDDIETALIEETHQLQIQVLMTRKPDKTWSAGISWLFDGKLSYVEKDEHWAIACQTLLDALTKKNEKTGWQPPLPLPF